MKLSNDNLSCSLAQQGAWYPVYPTRHQCTLPAYAWKGETVLWIPITEGSRSVLSSTQVFHPHCPFSESVSMPALVGLRSHHFPAPGPGPGVAPSSLLSVLHLLAHCRPIPEADDSIYTQGKQNAPATSPNSQCQKCSVADTQPLPSPAPREVSADSCWSNMW